MSVDLEFKGHVAIITINNPTKLGALTADMIDQLGHHLREAANNKDTYVTLLTGKGRFFCSGASIHENRATPANEDRRRHYVHHFATLLDIAQTFYTHSNILVTALNGPVVGLASALVSHSDFIYAVPHTYFFAPFNAIGIPVEGAGTRSIINRMGAGKAKEAMLMAKKIPVDELVACGFVNGVFDADSSGKDSEVFKQRVLKEVCEERLGDHLSPFSLLRTKQVMSQVERTMYDSQVVRELEGGVEAFESGHPQEQLMKLSRKERKHKL